MAILERDEHRFPTARGERLLQALAMPAGVVGENRDAVQFRHTSGKTPERRRGKARKWAETGVYMRANEDFRPFPQRRIGKRSVLHSL
jgi:hypothetical protein